MSTLPLRLSRSPMSTLILLLFLAGHQAAMLTYSDTKLVRTYIINEDQRTAVASLNLDFWGGDDVPVIGENVLRCNDASIRVLYQYDLPVQIFLGDVQNEVAREIQETAVSRENLGFGIEDDYAWFNSYHPYEEIYDQIQAYASDYSDLVKYESIGTTSEGRLIPLLKITGRGNPSGPKHKVIVLGGQRAREWLVPSVLLYIVQRLVELYNSDETVAFLLDNTEIHVVPLVNPDGYEYTWTTERLWRKNRNSISGSNGVDLNRNWGSAVWGSECGAESSETYCGQAAFSEPETSSVRDYVTANLPFAAAVDYNSYSQQIMWPYDTTPDRAPLVQSIAEGWASAMSGPDVRYNSQAACSGYNSSGNSRDWFFSVVKVPLCFTVNVRDAGPYGYLLPPSQIIPTGAENLSGFLYFLQAVWNWS